MGPCVFAVGGVRNLHAKSRRHPRLYSYNPCDGVVLSSRFPGHACFLVSSTRTMLGLVVPHGALVFLGLACAVSHDF